MTKRILFTGVGRRIELLQAFRQAALGLDVDLRIYGADSSETAPALAFCDYTRKICGMRDVDYISQLLKICEEDHIDLVVPTIDTDLLVLSQNADRFRFFGTRVLVSQPDKVALCRDKQLTADFFESCGLHAPRVYDSVDKYPDCYPCFVKPRNGSSSINAFKAESIGQLRVFAKIIGDYIIQPFIDGTEYTVDVFCDFHGAPVYVTPRIRTAVRSGEVLKTQISLDGTIIKECMAIVEAFKPCGPITVQLIRQKTTNIDYYIEINPRYGGGAPLSMKAGGRSARTVLELLVNAERLSRDEISDKAVFSRFDQSVRIANGAPQSAKGVIFDLDDTLYPEKEYVRSGFLAVARYLGNKRYADRLWCYFRDGKPAIDSLLADENLMSEKDKCLEVFRGHTPRIAFIDGALETLQKLRKAGVKLGVVTDGRITGQKKKIKVLGLERLVDDIIITDELGGTQFRKPNDISFRIIQLRWKIPFEQIVYVGDNTGKDFQAPRQLGMQTILFQNKEGLYYQPDGKLDGGVVIQKIDELVGILDGGGAQFHVVQGISPKFRLEGAA